VSGGAAVADTSTPLSKELDVSSEVAELSVLDVPLEDTDDEEEEDDDVEPVDATVVAVPRSPTQ